jgi:regulator of protease activity HflC (stomatin/prohibitin superfamily)
MEKQMTAERNRRALILTAEGDKQAAITRAEGEKQAAITRSEGNKQSAILDAEGAAQARMTNATAEAAAIQQIAGAIGDRGKTAQYLITARYVDSMRDMARTQNAKVIFMPTETTGVLASVGAFKEVFAETGEAASQPLKAPRSPRELEK